MVALDSLRQGTGFGMGLELGGVSWCSKRLNLVGKGFPSGLLLRRAALPLLAGDPATPHRQSRKVIGRCAD